MENKFENFNDYLTQLKEYVFNESNGNSKVGRIIRKIPLTTKIIEVNQEYFKELYQLNYSFENAILTIEVGAEDELYLKLDNFSNESLIEEISKRNLGSFCIDDVDTDDLERVLSYRYDSTLVNPDEISRQEHLNALNISEEDIISYDTLENVLCKVLGLNNTFSYTKDEIIEELKKKL